MKDETQSEELLYDLADLFRMFADSTRVRLLSALREKETGVTELANQIGMTASAVSHQLRILKDSRLVRSRREGKVILYSLADDHVRMILDMGKEHLEEGKGCIRSIAGPGKRLCKRRRKNGREA